MYRQTVWLSAEATRYEAECEACCAERRAGAPSPHIEGSLRGELSDLSGALRINAFGKVKDEGLT